jgi:hypothetical protein
LAENTTNQRKQHMRNDGQVDNEIGRLTAKLKRLRWHDSRVVIKEQITVLTLRLTVAQVNMRYAVDETSAEHRPNDADVLTACDAAARWLVEEEGVTAPSGKR